MLVQIHSYHGGFSLFHCHALESHRNAPIYVGVYKDMCVGVCICMSIRQVYSYEQRCVSITSRTYKSKHTQYIYIHLHIYSYSYTLILIHLYSYTHTISSLRSVNSSDVITGPSVSTYLAGGSFRSTLKSRSEMFSPLLAFSSASFRLPPRKIEGEMW